MDASSGKSGIILKKVLDVTWLADILQVLIALRACEGLAL